MSPSGSLNFVLRSKVSECGTRSVQFGKAPDRVGALFVFTVTVNVWATFKLPSLAVTVIAALPTATPVMLNVDPDTVTVALVVSAELAA